METKSVFLGRYLHDYTKLKNKDIPMSNYLDKENFPEQSEILGDIINIKYRSLCMERKHYHTPTRTIVDTDAIILRADNVYPFVFIALSLDDDQVIFTGDSRTFEDHIFTHQVQQKQFIDTDVQNYYTLSRIEGYQASVLVCDNGEPCYTVLIEYKDDTRLRFVLGDEVYSQFITNNDSEFDYIRSDSILVQLEGKKLDYGPNT